MAVPALPILDLTRAKLVDAAGEVFAERGFQAATVREICTRASANVAAVNYHFRDKTGLYTEVLRQSVGAAQGAALEEALAGSPPPEQALRKVIAGMLQRMFAGGRAAWNLRIMAHEMAHPTPALAHVVDEVMRPRYQQLREIVGQIIGLPAGHETTRLCAHSVIGQVIHYAHARPVIALVWPGLKMDQPAVLQRVASHIADVTLCYLGVLAKSNKKKGKRP